MPAKRLWDQAQICAASTAEPRLVDVFSCAARAVHKNFPVPKRIKRPRNEFNVAPNTEVHSLSIRVSIPVRVGLRIKLARGLFGYARGRNEDFIASAQVSGTLSGRDGGLRGPLWDALPDSHADHKFGDAFAEQSKRGNEHPEPPVSPGRSEGEYPAGNKHEADTHEDFGYRISETGGPAVFEIATTMSPVPSVGSFRQLTGQRLRDETQVGAARPAVLCVVGVLGCALWAIHLLYLIAVLICRITVAGPEIKLKTPAAKK